MTCDAARDAVLDRLAEGVPLDLQREVAAHVRSCAGCAAFAARQAALDARLAVALPPPALSRQFRGRLNACITAERRAQRWDLLPDVVHFGSCALATAVSTALIPINAMLVVAAGTTAALAGYVLLTAVRDSIDDTG